MTIPTEIAADIAGVIASAALAVFGWLALTMAQLVQKVHDLPCVREGDASCPDPRHRRRRVMLRMLMFLGIAGVVFFCLLVFSPSQGVAEVVSQVL
jgi:hypothetical protein